MADVTVLVAVVVPSSLAVGQTVKAVARITTDVDDGSQDTRPVVWSSSAPAVASVDALGNVKALASGSAVVRAAVGTVVGSATVTVAVPVATIDAAAEAIIKAVPVGGRLQLRGPTLVFDVQVSG